MQRALEPQPRDPVLDPQQLDVAAVGLHVRPHAVQRLLHALLERHRIEVVDQHQAGHDAVLDQALAQRASEPSSAIASKMRSRPSP